MLKKLWKTIDGKKLWTAITGLVSIYGIPYCMEHFPSLPWNEVLIPFLAALGITGIAHKMKKRKAEKMTVSQS